MRSSIRRRWERVQVGVQGQSSKPRGRPRSGSFDNTSFGRHIIERPHARDASAPSMTSRVTDSPPPPASTRETANTSRTRSPDLSHPRVPGCVLGVVADGMGGRSGGRKASDQVMMTAQQLFDRYSPGPRRRRSAAQAAGAGSPHRHQADGDLLRAGAAQHAGRPSSSTRRATATGSTPATRASTTSTAASWSSAPWTTPTCRRWWTAAS